MAIELFKGKMFACVGDAQTDFQEKLFDWHGKTYVPELYLLFMQMGGAYGSDMFDLRDILKKVKCPALVLYPDRSRLFWFAYFGIDNSKTVWLKLFLIYNKSLLITFSMDHA